MFKATNLDVDGVSHGFLSREGGTSCGIYASLNCAFGSKDTAENVTENRRLAVQRAGLGAAPLVTCAQIHSSSVVRVGAPWSPANAPQADALVTNIPSLALGILTADCAPVLFADATAGVIGAAHAGWKGAVGGVLEATIAAMVDLGASPQTIRAAIGPCIHQASYEVGRELRDHVLAISPWAENVFQDGKPRHFYFDLPGYVAARLKSEGVDAVERINVDTYDSQNKCFSYRRSTHRSEPDYGRQVSIIGLGAK